MAPSSISTKLGITPEYEALLREFASRFPRFFWQINFWGGAGAAAVGLAVVEALLPGTEVRAAIRLGLYLLVGAVSAQLIQRRYRSTRPARPAGE